MQKWTKVAGIVAGIALLSTAGVYAVRKLTRNPTPDVHGESYSLEDEWAKTIRTFGIEPVFPPEEDLTVGDVLAVVVKDNEPDKEFSDTRVSPRAPLLKRSVKLAHIDVRAELGKAYAVLPVFVMPESGAASIQTNAAGGSVAIELPKVTRLFTKDMVQSDLPRAAFPNLKIQGLNSAAVGIAAAGRGSAGYGASNQGVEELNLTEVRTYGLPSADALELLNTYCIGRVGKNVCQEKTARRHLERIVGDGIYRKYVVDNIGNETYSVTVDIVIVNRVYLARSIRNLNKTGSTEYGAAGVGTASGTTNERPTEEIQQKTPPISEPTSEHAELEALRKRLSEVEKQLGKVTAGAALNFNRAYENEALLNENFDRPVAIGYRSVRFDFNDSKPAN